MPIERVMDTSTIDRDMVSSLNHSMSSESEEDHINSDKDMATNRELSSGVSLVMVQEVMIEDNLWHQRLQDKVYNKENLPKATYKKFRIIALSTSEIPVYYYHLAFTAIDMDHKMEI